MCGLTLSITARTGRSSCTQTALQALQSSIDCRGPDSRGSYTLTTSTSGGSEVETTLTSTVLGLRGDLTCQPLVGRGVLGWNGQVFEGLDIGSSNDTRMIFEDLEKGQSVKEVLSRIEGPFACIYLDLETSTLHYRIDPLSRRSLLIYPANISAASDGIYNEKTDTFILSSCCCSKARDEGIEMRALLGGEGGEIRLENIAVDDDGQMDFSNALIGSDKYGSSSSSSTPFAKVSPINTILPPPSLPEPQNPWEDPILSSTIDSFISSLQESVMRRVDNIPSLESGQSRVALLFSGGIDCTFLAYLLHQCLPPNDPIDLINVAFAPSPSPPGKDKRKVQTSTLYQVPDRLSGLSSVDELRKVCPRREWRFVEVDVPYEEARSQRARVVELMYPSVTEMDLSLAYPLYFAARGVGWLTEQGERRAYRVKAKVYLSGLGADEQLGGYSRHRHAFIQNGWQGLIDETQMDIARLPTRNLSRDDRILSSHARDARYPFLSLSFISYLSSIPIHLKCDPRLPPGEGDKRLLRLASKRVGLVEAGGRVKRAMQFGTRSSKVGGAGVGVKGPKAGERHVE